MSVKLAPPPPLNEVGSCPGHELLELIASGTLREHTIETHIEHCASCRRVTEDLRELDGLVSRLGPALQADPHRSGFPSIGDLVRGYRVGEEIGRGGQSRVHRAVRLEDNSPVVLKFISSGLFATTEQRIRRDREIATLAEINHPNVVRLLDHGISEDGLLFTALEYIGGTTITTHPLWNMERGLTELVKRFDALLDAMECVHQSGLIHRDLKPENVLVDEDGVPTIIDFGLTKAVNNDQGGMTMSLTDHGAFLGTLRYAAPEQFDRRLGGVGAHTDVYALGVLLYELLTGNSPFAQATTTPQLVTGMHHGSATDRASLSALPRRVRRALMRATARDPIKRYPSVRAFRNALHACDPAGVAASGQSTSVRLFVRLWRALSTV